MPVKHHKRNARQVSDIASGLLDPILRKRSGISMSLISSWEEIAGPRLAAGSRPERISWPRRVSENEPFEPATLVIACEGFAALAMQHETNELIGRINAFLGFAAIARIRIVQRPVLRFEREEPRKPRPLNGQEEADLKRQTAGIEDEGLRAALERLGRGVIGNRDEAGKKT